MEGWQEEKEKLKKEKEKLKKEMEQETALGVRFGHLFGCFGAGVVLFRCYKLNMNN